MSDDKRATLKKILLAAMTVGVLGRIAGLKAVAHAQGLPSHSATSTPAGSTSTGIVPVALPGSVDTNDVAFPNAIHNMYAQTFSNLFVDTWFLEIMCW